MSEFFVPDVIPNVFPEDFEDPKTTHVMAHGLCTIKQYEDGTQVRKHEYGGITITDFPRGGQHIVNRAEGEEFYIQPEDRLSE